LIVLASTTSDIVVSAIGFLGVVVTAFFGYLGQRAVRQQTVPSQEPEYRHSSPSSSRKRVDELDREVEGYIVRFILFSLSASAWGAVLNVANPFIYFSGTLTTIAIGAVFTLIFLLLGMPLLVDIVRRYGIRPRGHLHSPRSERNRATE
jgi:hypothetical protein